MHKFRFVEFNSFANLIEKTLSDVFGLLSACGEIYIGRSMPVLATYFRTALSENYLLLIASPPAAEYALTFSRFQLPYFLILALGILGKIRLLMTPPLEDCLTRLKGSSTQAGTGCTYLQLICGSVAWQPFSPDWSLLAGNKAPVCPRHEGGRGCMTEADTSRVVLPRLVSLQHRHKPGLMVADC